LKERGINTEFKKSELDKLGSFSGGANPITQTFYATRSKRLTGIPGPAPGSHASS
jgi:hypothetical protein